MARKTDKADNQVNTFFEEKEEEEDHPWEKNVKLISLSSRVSSSTKVRLGWDSATVQSCRVV